MVNTHTHTHIRVCVCACACVCVCVYYDTYMCVSVCVCVYYGTYMCMCVCVCLYYDIVANRPAPTKATSLRTKEEVKNTLLTLLKKMYFDDGR